MNGNRNADILQRIVMYCDQIEQTVNRFGADYTAFQNDFVYRNAVSLCVLQIGELTGHLTDAFKETYNEMPWAQIKGLRNVVAHGYGKIDMDVLYDTITSDIPKLKAYCADTLKQFEVLTQESLAESDERKETHGLSMN